MLQLPRFDPAIPLSLTPRASRQRGALLAKAMINSGLVRDEHLPARTDASHLKVAQAALRSWVNEQLGSLRGLRPKFVMAVGPHDLEHSFGEHAGRRDGAVIEWSCEGGAFAVGPELERLERLWPRLGMTVLAVLEEAAWRTVPLYSPQMILEAASRIYWCGDEDEREAIAMSCQTEDEARDMAASMVTREMVEAAYPAWALRRGKRMREISTRTLRGGLRMVRDRRARAVIEDVIALRGIPLPKRDWRDREGDFAGFAGALTWGEKDQLSFRVVDDYEQMMGESGEYFEDCGRVFIDPAHDGALSGWIESMKPWFKAVRLIDSLLHKLTR